MSGEGSAPAEEDLVLAQHSSEEEVPF